MVEQDTCELGLDALERLGLLSQTDSGRQQLIDNDAVSSVTASLSGCVAAYIGQQGDGRPVNGCCIQGFNSTPSTSGRWQQPSEQSLLLHLRCLRNLCAAGSSVSDKLLEQPQWTVFQHIFVALPAILQGNAQTARAASQLSANIAATSSRAATALWDSCFPDFFEKLAGLFASDVGTLDALCRALWCCCTAEPSNAAPALCSSRGALVWKNILSAVTQDRQKAWEWLHPLIAHLALQRGLLEQLFWTAGSNEESHPVPSSWDGLHQRQAVLLDLLRQHIEAHAEAPEYGASARPAMEWLLHCIHTAATQLNLVHAPAILDAAMKVLRAASGTEEPSSRPWWCPQGLVPQVLSMLGSLAPVQQKGSASAAAPHDPGHAPYPATQPYKGYRSDLVAVLANAVHGRPEVQEEVRLRGGVELMLAQCQVDENSPFVREWALWGVRNLCEGNEAVQATIEELQAHDVAASPELRDLGFELQQDGLNGKIRIKSRPQ